MQAVQWLFSASRLCVEEREHPPVIGLRRREPRTWTALYVIGAPRTAKQMQLRAETSSKKDP